MKRTKRMAPAALAVAIILGGCEDATGPDHVAGTLLSVGFTAGGGASSSQAPSGPSYGLFAEPLVITGSNGTLAIDDVRLVVAEFELERVEGECGQLAGDLEGDDGCEKFEAPPAFIDVPLMGGTAIAVTQEVPAGRYDELEFEVEDLDDDEGDAEEAAQIAALLMEIRSEFPEWPREASLMVEGTFTPTGGSAVSFRSYFEAEIEIELDLLPPLDLTADGATRAVTVEIDPARWFRRPDGSVLDLSRLDFATTGRVVEFEVEMEQGFERIEF